MSRKLFACILLVFLFSFTIVTAVTMYPSGWSCEGTTCQCAIERCYYPNLAQEGLAENGEIIYDADITTIKELSFPKQEWWLVEGRPYGTGGSGLVIVVSAFDADDAREKFTEKNNDSNIEISYVVVAQVGVPVIDNEGWFLVDDKGNKVYAPQEMGSENWYIHPENSEWAWNPDEGKWVPSSQVPKGVPVLEGEEWFLIDDKGNKVYAPQETRGEKWYIPPEKPEWAWNPDEEKWVSSSQVPFIAELDEGSASPPQPAPQAKTTASSQPVQKGTVGAKVEGSTVYEGCRNKRFGLVGASNTVDQDPKGNKVHPSMKEILEQSCLGSKVHLYAKGGYGPKSQKSLVSSLLAEHSDLNYVILDVSVNEIREHSLEDYTEDVIELTQMVKEKNSNIKVVILAPTPFKGPNYWSQDQQDKQDAFNQNLLNNRLGTSFIDYAVDTYSALEDPPGSDSCGRYCKGDNLHFFDGTGRKVVIKTMLDTVFGAPKTAIVVTSTPVSPISSVLIAENCLNKQRCNEIDDVWLKIVSWINVARKNLLWDTARNEWRQKDQPSTVVITPEVQKPGAIATTNLCVAAAGTTEQKALLDTIAWAEGTREKYSVMFGGKQFTNYAAHPVETGEMPEKGFPWSGGTSTAAGRYQFLYGTYKNLKTSGFFQTGFNPQEQDKAGLYLVETTRRLSQEELTAAVNSDNLVSVWDKLAAEWASLPSSGKGGKSFYSGQSARSYQDLKNIFQTCLQYHNTGGISLPSAPATGEATFSACPPEMSNIDNDYCVDKWENIVVDKTTGQQASYNWVPDPALVGGQKSLMPNPLQPPFPDATGPQFSSSFVPSAVSKSGVFPQTYMNRKIAEAACANAGKRLCTREEWYNACVGPDGPKVIDGATILPEVMPYGTARIANVCNDNQQANHPPSKLGQSQVITQDPRLAEKAQELGAVAMTGQFSQCTNEYVVFDMAGNVDEIVSDVPVQNPSNMMFVGGFYSRSQTGINGIHCGSRIIAHEANSYYDYSVGFRCCATLS